MTSSWSEPTPPLDHRKTIQHYDVHRQARLLTFSCYRRLPLLDHEPHCRLLADGLGRAIDSHGFLLIAFVFMPEHVHLVVVPWEHGATVAPLLSAIKRPVSFRIKRELERARDPLITNLTIRERPGKWSFRFWQEGPGHDRNLDGSEALGNAIAYVHDNPLRRGLCAEKKDWKWSSFRQYADLEIEQEVPRVTRWCWGMGYELNGPWPKLRTSEKRSP